MNRLSKQTSPYLRQHQHNPVDWYPWGSDAFAEAAKRDVPVLLSIGYSACHWCHVMAHECFEDSEIAALMNSLFVNIKVDREERPDVDAIYMDAVQSMTGRGGWPLTVFLTPDAEPFFGGTYFPPKSFADLMHRVDQAWSSNRAALLTQASELTTMLKQAAARKPDLTLPNTDVTAAGSAELLASHDSRRGGFGGAPKFPQAMNIEALLRHHRRTADTASLNTAMHSLKAMICGGIYDHVGGGFARYSVDADWDIPHFEKMLYDQALIASAILHAWQLTKDPDLALALTETLDYVLRDLTNASGGFCSAEDADANGIEGSFTVFTPIQIFEILGEADGTTFCDWYGITEIGNFEDSSNPRRPPGSSIARTKKMEALRARVFAAREQRIRPGLDDKVLLEWNGLMLSTLSEAAAAFDNKTWFKAAQRNAEFLLQNLRDEKGEWRRSWASGQAQHSPIAADLAAIADGFTRLYEASGQSRWLDAAMTAADRLLADHHDTELGGFFTTGANSERLIARSKDLMDNATPAGNSLAAVALLRLGALSGRPDYRQAGLGAIRLVSSAIEQHPTAFGHLLGAVALAQNPPAEVVITGERPDLLQPIQSGFYPDLVLSWGERIPGPLWDGREDGLAFVCRDHTCQAPVTSSEQLIAQLR